jgi:uncharacterized protein (DUF2235 family)
MAKNIVFCADGTWNGPAQEDSARSDDAASNVFNLYCCLAGEDVIDPAVYRAADEQERVLKAADGTKAQVAKYLHGVGDSQNFLVKALGGALGAGVITRIVRGYTFLSRNYEAGDRITIVGFSRGAYTARALAGLVGAKGLIDASKHGGLLDKEEAYRLGCAVWADYRSAICARPDRNWVQAMEGVLDHLPRFFGYGPRVELVPDVGIETVAVWDTVGALGIPAYQADHCRLDVFRFCDDVLGAKVRHGRHAIAIDDQRADFTPTLWQADEARIVQMLFPGAHADVGGGYTRARSESGLSDGALKWMIEELQMLGVQFRPELPIDIEPIADAPAHQPWLHLPWTLTPQQPRAGLGHLPAHASYHERLGKDVFDDPAAKARRRYGPKNGPEVQGEPQSPGAT